MDNLLTPEVVKIFLEINQADLEKYLKRNILHAYKIGGTYLRFRKEDVLNLRFDLTPKKDKSREKISIFSRAGEFWRFNNFYIISLLIVIALAVFAAKT